MKFTTSLKKNFQFRYVYHKGKSVANRQLVLYTVKNGTKENKLGISVSKKVGKSVVRSHVTRLIRESYRTLEPDIKAGYSFVIIARIPTNACTYHEVLGALRHLLKKQQLLSKPQIKENNGESRKG